MGCAVKVSSQSKVFGRRKEPHTVIIARGNELRHFTVRPWILALAGSVAAVVTLGYLTATTYLVLRDDLIGAAAARQARMQQAYEDRISALRAQVDRITSRQLLDQQLVESKVGELLQRQSELSARHKSLAPMLDDSADGTLPANAPLPVVKPDQKASLDQFMDKPGQALAYASADTASAPFSFWSTRKSDVDTLSSADRADLMFLAINRSLRSIEEEQMSKVESLADNTYETADAIGDALGAAGFKVGGLERSDVGGPLIPLDGPAMFDSKVKELDDALAKLNSLKQAIRQLPIANPANDWVVTSSFGGRKDPFLGSSAFHSGMDFRAPAGAPIKVAGAGVVIKAEWSGGYGRLVEVDHGGGYTTRYAHMSKILVSEGDTLKIGDVVGEVGSSGRSTGPHLHYEVRKNGASVDPQRFIKAGKQVDRYLAAK